MKHKLIIGMLTLCGMAAGQLSTPASVQPRFSAFQSVTSAVAVVTISLPVNSTRYAHLIRAFVSCSAACNLVEELNATAATTTVATAAKLRKQSDTPVAIAYTASNIAASAVITHPLAIAAGVLTTIDLSHIYLSKSTSTLQSFTLRTDGATGTNGITLIWEEISTL